MRAAFVEFLDRLDPAELEARFERAARRGKARSADKASTGSCSRRSIATSSRCRADHLPHTFVEAFAAAYRQHASKQPPEHRANYQVAERVGFEPTCRNYPTIRFRVGAVMTASVPLRVTTVAAGGRCQAGPFHFGAGILAEAHCSEVRIALDESRRHDRDRPPLVAGCAPRSSAAGDRSARARRDPGRDPQHSRPASTWARRELKGWNISWRARFAAELGVHLTMYPVASEHAMQAELAAGPGRYRGRTADRRHATGTAPAMPAEPYGCIPQTDRLPARWRPAPRARCRSSPQGSRCAPAVPQEHALREAQEHGGSCACSGSRPRPTTPTRSKTSTRDRRSYAVGRRSANTPSRIISIRMCCRGSICRSSARCNGSSAAARTICSGPSIASSAPSPTRGRLAQS